MCENVTTDWFSPICSSKERACTRVALDLVGHQDGDVKFCVGQEIATAVLNEKVRRSLTFSYKCDRLKELAEFLLPLR
jgi:hypothetical protein